MLVRSLIELIQNPELPFLEVFEVFSPLSGRIPAILNQNIIDFLTRESGKSISELRSNIISCIGTLSPQDQIISNDALFPVFKVLDIFGKGSKKHETDILVGFLENYYSIERVFHDRRYDDVILELRDEYKVKGLKGVVAIARAYANSKHRSSLVLSILDQVRSAADVIDEDASKYLPIVEKLASLNSPNSSKVSLKAREFLIFFQMPSYEERYKEILCVLSAAVNPSHSGKNNDAHEFDYGKVITLITANYAILDVLPVFFYHENKGVRAIALYTYVLHTSQAYTINQVKLFFDNEPVVFEWEFSLRSSGTLASPGLTKRNLSYGSLSSFSSSTDDSPRRGLIFAFEKLNDFEANLNKIIETASSRNVGSSLVNILLVAIRLGADDILSSDSTAIPYFSEISKNMSRQLNLLKYKRATFMLIRENCFPRYYTFQQHLDYKEDQVIRHIEPAMTYQLELQRLVDFDISPIFVDNRRIHMYHSIAKSNPSDDRFFIRALVYPGQVVSYMLKPSDFLVSEGNRILGDVLDNLEVVWRQYPNSDCNHLFINFIPTFELGLESIESCLKELVDKHGKRLWKLRVSEAEIRFIMRNGTSIRPVRFVISSSTGYVARVDIYQETRDSFGIQRLMSITSPPGRLHKQPVHQKYEVKESIQPKRYKAHLMGTTYVYDFPDLFKRALEKTWIRNENETMARPPSNIINYPELVLDKDGELSEIYREPGLNSCGMVAWILDLFTPEYPEGRKVVVIANDVTFNIGSFGPDEDEFFFKVTQYARKRGIPRIYISANSGARIGLAEEVSLCFKIRWQDALNQNKGVKYLYLEKSDYLTLNQVDLKSVVCTEIIEDGISIYRIDAIIGKQHGIGVENLQGSGLIAGETSKAYDDIFTLTLVTCRSVGKFILTVGIGAYLVRLGQRTIQVEYSPIILTGSGALNKVLGREVYSSNLQLGGTQIMFKNGISHLVAHNDMEGILKTLKWISYIPKTIGSPLPVLPSSDSIDRNVDTMLLSGPYNPRELLCGYIDSESNAWIAGFFDKDSFTETLSGWAKGVVVGRARLGGTLV